MLRLAFDIGGTFTDFVMEDTESGAFYFWKIPSTPDSPADAVMSGIADLLAQTSHKPADVGVLLHATTIATNAILERKGVKTALITTKGFRDVLIVGRQKRYETYDLHLDKPKSLVRRRDIFEIAERTLADGTIEREIDVDAMQTIVDGLVEYDSVAVCFLHAYANGKNEALVAQQLAAAHPKKAISISSEVSPRYREYERTSTVVANAYVKPIVSRYVANLERSLESAGINSDMFIMQSNGGLVTPELASAVPVRIVESGPAAGVLMCGVVGRREGYPNVLTFDMGGTTAKLGAIDNGEAAVVPSFEVDQIRYKKGSGLPLSVPSIELLEIGAGGGSIATVDMGLIRVGPESAGADPGPMCYMKGGRRPTVTDANVALGYINPDYFNGGMMILDRDAAMAGIEEHIARSLKISTTEAAWGIHALANANMERAMRIVSIERGRDPRRYALVALGGAAPLHAARLARQLGLPKVIIPVGAGVGSALGLLEAGSKLDVALTKVLTIDDNARDSIAMIFKELERRLKKDMDRLSSTGGSVLERFAYLRYRGQGHELRVRLPDGSFDERYIAGIVDRFQVAYEKVYGYREPDAKIEGVDWSLIGQATHRTSRERTPVAKVTRPAAWQGRDREAYFKESGFTMCRVIDRYSMVAGEVVQGPALIEERESTTVALPGDQVMASESGNLIVTIGGGAS